MDETKKNMSKNNNYKDDGYVWEEGLIKTWEEIPIENKIFNDIYPVSKLIKKSKQLRAETKVQHNRASFMRKLFIIIDFSEAMNDIDFEPNGIDVIFKYLGPFAQDFLRGNPLSQLGFIKLIGNSAEILSNLSSNYAQHIKVLKKSDNRTTYENEISILNGIELALANLRVTPRNFSREILIIMAAVSTCDPPDLNEIIKFMANEGIRVSVISLTADVHICSKMAKLTKGSYSVVFNDEQFQTELMEHLEPPIALDNQEKVLMKAGFPYITNELNKNRNKSLSDYECPQCSSKCNELPTACGICGLMLITVAQLAQAYQHLSPVQPFTEIAYNAQVALCYACQKEFSMKKEFNVYCCELCKHYFCVDCNTFIHETLHSCVGCSCTQPTLPTNINIAD